MEQRSYAIISYASLTQEVVDACLETTMTSVRKSNDSRVVVKWLTANGKPDVLSAETELNSVQALVEMAKSEWHEP